MQSDTVQKIRQYQAELRRLSTDAQVTRQEVRRFKQLFLQEMRASAQRAIDVKLAEQRSRRQEYQKHIQGLDEQVGLLQARPRQIDAERQIGELNRFRLAYKDMRQGSDLNTLLNKLSALIKQVQDFLYYQG